ncbi:hypothetical protein IVG45_06190 [Methylomonas sp. LL1]|uniref:hypothetical protein n=1 Tax=Methylomonas sp. LL1 TaxID=2785785 RepID=UPI0018C35754|nr:hypothetical protein [Methylomonas sp. LL1]QPK65712.1 hypothetical protein IVG45_06190 [Methylomonas sp. LL1]
MTERSQSQLFSSTASASLSQRLGSVNDSFAEGNLFGRIRYALLRVIRPGRLKSPLQVLKKIIANQVLKRPSALKDAQHNHDQRDNQQ